MEIATNQSRPHGRAVSCRKHATAARPKPKPQLHASSSRCQADPRRQAEKPPSQTPAQPALKRIGVIGMSQQALGDKERMLRVVAQHAASEYESVTPRIRPHSPSPIRRDALGRQAQSIAHGGAQKDARQTVSRRSAPFSVHPTRPIVAQTRSIPETARICSTLRVAISSTLPGANSPTSRRRVRFLRRWYAFRQGRAGHHRQPTRPHGRRLRSRAS